jgi:antitoxin VapB
MLERQVRIFRNGRNQAVRIPRSFEWPGNEAILRNEGDRLVLEPLPKQSLFEVLHSWKGSSENFPEVTDSLPEPVELRHAGTALSARHQYPF